MNSERGKFSSQDQELDKDNLPFWLLLSIVLEILDNVIRQNVKGVQNGEENKDKTVYFPMHSDCLHIIPKHLPKKKNQKKDTRTNLWVGRPQDKNQYTKMHHISTYYQWKVGNCNLKIYNLQ